MPGLRRGEAGRTVRDLKVHISNEVRAKSLTFTSSPEGTEVKTWDVTGKEITTGISPIE